MNPGLTVLNDILTPKAGAPWSAPCPEILADSHLASPMKGAIFQPSTSGHHSSQAGVLNLGSMDGLLESYAQFLLMLIFQVKGSIAFSK